MPATMQSVTTQGYGIGGGFVGDINLTPSLGYGLGAAVDLDEIKSVTFTNQERSISTVAQRRTITVRPK